MARHSKSHKQKSALEYYCANGGNVTKTSKHVGVSRVTIISWRDKGLPTAITGGDDWDTYKDKMQAREIAVSKSRQLEKDFNFHEEAMDTLEIVLRELRAKLELGDFDAKPSDVPKIIEMFFKLDTRDADMKNWMNGVMIQIMQIIADTVTPQQYAVIGTKLMDLNRKTTEKLDLLEDPGLPQLPAQGIVEDVTDVDYEVSS